MGRNFIGVVSFYVIAAHGVWANVLSHGAYKVVVLGCCDCSLQLLVGHHPIILAGWNVCAGVLAA